MATGQYTDFPIDWKSLDASQVPYSNSASGMTATDVQNAIDELNTDLNAIDASDIPYDNTASGLTADDVQEALDELASEKQDTLTAGDGITILSDTISTDNDDTLTSAVQPAQAKAVGDALSLKADSDGNYENMTVGTADSVLGTPTTESVPYLFRRSASIGVRESDKIIGGTVAWNQLEKSNRATESKVSVTMTQNNNGSVTFNGTASANEVFYPGTISTANKTVKDHVYVWGCVLSATPTGFTPIFRIGETNSANAIRKASDSNLTLNVGYNIASGTVLSNVTAYSMCYDLTAMLGSQIAGYVYTLESGTSGAGIAWLRANGFGYILDNYHTYDSGSLQSVKTSAHKTVGKNLIPYPYASASGTTNGVQFTVNSDGSVTANGTAGAGNAYFYLFQNVPNIWNGCIMNGCPTGGALTGKYKMQFYDLTLNTGNDDIGSGSTITRPNGDNCQLVIIIAAGFTVSNLTFYPMLRYADADANYTPYDPHVYPLDSSLELRGIPKLDGSNKLYYDGDTYASDGTVVRKYGSIDLGSLSWEKDTTSLTYTVFKTPYGQDPTNRKPGSVNMVCSKYFSTFDSRGSLNTYDNAIATWNTSNSATVAIRDDSKASLTADQFKTAMNGVYLVYELAIPTTETADPFHDPQICSPYGTEEYVDTRDVPVPVGHETEYYADPVAEIERVAVQVPVPPTVAGSYRLTCTVSGGVPTYLWTS